MNRENGNDRIGMETASSLFAADVDAEHEKLNSLLGIKIV